MRINLKVWRQAGRSAGAAGGLHGRATSRPTCRSSRCSTSSTKTLIAQGRRPDRVRLRLPRRHLRHLRVDDQRLAARPGSAARRSASCTCGGSRTATRSPSSRGAPRRFPSSRIWSSTAARSTGSSQAGGYISVNAAAPRTRNTILIPKDTGRTGDGLGGLHRLRRMRGGLQERLGGALHVAPRSATWPCCRRAKPERETRVVRWSSGTTPKGSAAARTKASARPSARRKSRSPTSPG